MTDKRTLSSTSRPHPILAAFFDFYFTAILLMALFAIFTVVSNRMIYTVKTALITFLIILFLVIFYHIFLNRKVKFLSIGERMVGKIWAGKEKIWANPYDKNRWFLFLLIIITLLFLGNDWDALETNIIPLGVIIGKILKVGLVFVGFLLICKGKRGGAFIPFSIFFINTILYFIAFISLKDSLILVSTLLYFLISIGYLLILIFYRKQKQ